MNEMISWNWRPHEKSSGALLRLGYSQKQLNDTGKTSNNARIVYVDVKEKYGNTLYYPACENGLRFADMTGNKTLRMVDLNNIKALGFTVQALAPELGV